MRKFKLLVFLMLFAVIIFSSSSCKKEGPATFTLVMKAKYGNQSFALNATNTDATGRYISMTSLTFYLSHISLIKTNGTTVTLSDLAIFDFTDSSTLSVSVNNVEGDFSGISFSCGVDSNQNKTNANEAVFPSPFSGLWGMYWDMNSGYRYEVMEGKWAATDSFNMPNYLVYHIGNNINYRQTKLNKNFSVCCKTPGTLTLYLDVQQIFSNSITGESINIVTQPETSSGVGDNPVIASTFADNFSNAFTF